MYFNEIEFKMKFKEVYVDSFKDLISFMKENLGSFIIFGFFFLFMSLSMIILFPIIFPLYVVGSSIKFGKNPYDKFKEVNK